MATGKGNKAKLGQVVEIDGETDVSCWKQPCSIISGSPDSVIYPPMSHLGDSLSVFSFELNRSLSFDYQEDTSTGLPEEVVARKFVLSKKSFESDFSYEENACFRGSNDRYVTFSGLLFNSHCNSKSPFVYSLPHFYDSGM